MRQNTFNQLISVNSFSKSILKDRKGQIVGQIEDIVMDMNTAKVSHIIASMDKFEGKEDQYFVIPWDELIFNQEQGQVVVDKESEVLECAPHFHHDLIPDFHNKSFIHEVNSFYREN